MTGLSQGQGSPINCCIFKSMNCKNEDLNWAKLRIFNRIQNAENKWASGMALGKSADIICFS